MKLPPFIPSIEPAIKETLIGKLSEIENDFGVRILFAIESGSRAWGFPSPDSDYDVRFVYAHQSDWYLSLKPGRDVIELPVEGDLDINGWDIRKALNLLMKPNPVLLEWLSSPIRYAWKEDVCHDLLDLAGRTTFGEACLHHYRNVAQGQWQKHVGKSTEINYKKYFYIFRPALAIHWIRSNPGTTPPMNLQALVEGLPLSTEMVAEIQNLLHLKAQAKEIGEGKRVSIVDDYILDQIGWANAVEKFSADPGLEEDAETLFRAIVRGGVQSCKSASRISP